MPQIINALFPAESLQNYTIKCFTGPDQEEIRSKFGALAVDVTKSFLMGQVTSPLKAITGSKAVKSVGELMNSTQGLITTVGQYMDPEEITHIVTTIVKNTVNSVVSYVGKDVAKGMQTILDFPEASYFGTEAFKRFSSKASSYAADLLTSLRSTGAQSAGVNVQEAMDFSGKRVSGFEKKISYISSKVNNFVSTYSSIAAYWVTEATNYAAMGPDWVEMQISHMLRGVLSKVHQWIQTAVDAIEGVKIEVINSIIDWLADQLYGIFRYLVKRIQDNITPQIEKEKKRSEIAGKIAMNKAIALIQEKTGLNIETIDEYAIIQAAESMKSKLNLVNLVTTLLSSGGMTDYEQNYDQTTTTETPATTEEQ